MDTTEVGERRSFELAWAESSKHNHRSESDITSRSQQGDSVRRRLERSGCQVPRQAASQPPFRRSQRMSRLRSEMLPMRLLEPAGAGCRRYVAKGGLFIDGHVCTQKHDDRNGDAPTITEVVGARFQLLDGHKNGDGQDQGSWSASKCSVSFAKTRSASQGASVAPLNNVNAGLLTH